MFKSAVKSRSRRNHRGLSNSRNHLARRDVYNRRLRMEPLEDRCLLSVAPLSVALISDAVAEAQQVRAAAAMDTIAIVYHADTMTTTGLVDLLASVSAAHNGAPIGHLGIVTHGGSGELDLGNADDLSLATLPSQAAALERLRSVLTSDARMDLYSCSVAAGADGKTFVDELSAVTGAAVFASDNPVGTVPGSDFVWEYHTGQAAESNDLFSVQEIGTIPRLCLAVEDYYYYQRDPRWCGDPLGTSTETIGSAGCAITCVAMLLKWESGSSRDPDPGQFNAWLTDYEGYSNENWIDWSVAANYDGEMGLTLIEKTTGIDQWSQIDAELAAGRKPIVTVDGYPDTPTLETHYVVVYERVGTSGIPSSYKILDPDPRVAGFDPNWTLEAYRDPSSGLTTWGYKKYGGTFPDSSVNHPPIAPTNVEPANGATGVSLTPTLRGSAFSDPDPGDYHWKTWWDIRRVSDNVVVWESDWRTFDLTSTVVPAGKLDFNTSYKWRVRYMDDKGDWSEPLPVATTFTTQAAAQPNVDSFDPDPKSLFYPNPVTISYTVSDIGGPGLQQVELWRAPDSGGEPGDWGDEAILVNPASGTAPVLDRFIDVPPPGVWWYGIHVRDTNLVSRTEEECGLSPISVVVALDVMPPTADLYDPANGGSIVLSTFNGRAYIDVTFSDAGSGLNTSTITDSGQEFTLSGAAASGVSVNGSPTLLSGTTYRYSFTGSFGTGAVSVNFTAGSFADNAVNTNASATESFTVNDINHSPTDIALSNSIVAENQSAGTVVSVVSGTDPDAGQSATLTFSLVSGYGDNAWFTIDPATKQLKTAAVFDYETKDAYSIKIQATDTGSPVLTYDELFTITVTNANEQPTDIASSNSSVAENQPAGTTVGTLSTTDPDSSNTFTYSLVTGTGSTDNASFTISSGTLQTAASFDYESKNSYSIRIHSMDQGGLWTEKVFAISVTDVAEQPQGIVLSTNSIVVPEGGTAQFTVKLAAPPVSNVTVAIAKQAGGDVDLSTNIASLTFTPSDWNTPKPVTLSAAQDADASNGTAGFLVSSTGLTTQTVTATEQDDDHAGITVTPTSGLVTTELGVTATFTVQLNTPPTADVTIGLSSNAPTEGMVLPTSLTFTSSEWSTPQTVTVTGVDDQIVDGNVAYTIVTAAAASTDASYNGLNAADVSVTNNDNDVPGLTVTVIPATFAENAGSSAATGTVTRQGSTASALTVNLGSSDPTEATVQATVTILAGQSSATFPVNAVDDDVDDDAQSVTITVSATGHTSGNAQLEVTDDDTAGITVNPTSEPVTTEEGGTATFTVVLNSKPTENVTIDLSSSDTTEGTVSPTELIFEPEEWDKPKEVTVTGVDDQIVDGNVAYTIVTVAATSTDANYSGLNAADVSVTNNDNDVVLPALSISNVSLIEGDNGTKTFTFTVSMSGANTQGTSVSYATANGTATAGSDYVAASGTLTWAAGDTSAKTISVTANGDTTVEADETFYVNLSGASGATIFDSQGIGTIQNDDAPDTTAPGNVTSFTATPGNGQVSLSWSNPSDSDFEGVKILRKTGSYPTSHTDGTTVYNNDGTSYTDTGRTNGTTYYYKAFTYDEVPNYSSGSSASATPQSASVGFYEGFEGEWWRDWLAGGSSVGWGDNSAKVYAGAKSVFCAYDGDASRSTYSNNIDTRLQQNVSLAGLSSATLSFQYWMNTEAGYDFFRVFVWIPSTGQSDKLLEISGNESAAGWQTRTLDMTPYAGMASVTIQFDFNSDASVVPNSPSGVWLDEVALTEGSVFGNAIGVFQNGSWLRDVNRDGTWDSGDGNAQVFGWNGATPVTGDWNGDGTDEIGVYAGGAWYLDVNGNGTWDGSGGGDTFLYYGWDGALPVVGDWNGDGTDDVGVYNLGVWFRDVNGNRLWDAPDSSSLVYLGWSGATPVPGDWNSDGTDDVGVYALGAWFRDVNGNNQWDATDSAAIMYYGWNGPLPVVGDWNGDGTDDVGVYNLGAWFRDLNGNNQWDSPDVAGIAYFGWSGALPVVGNWSSSGSPLMAADGQSLVSSALPTLTQADLQPIVLEAVAQWAAVGLETSILDRLSRVEFVIADLSGCYLGKAEADRIYIDSDAAGYGWFVDPTPDDDEEFILDDLGSLLARKNTAADGRADLLTAVMHELGHVLGYDHADEGLMDDLLPLGTRRTATDEIFGGYGE